MSLSDIDVKVLRALPNDLRGRWLSAQDVADRLHIAPDVARSVLVRLRGAWLVEDDGERPQAFARLARGDHELELVD